MTDATATRRSLYPGPKVVRMPSGAAMKLAHEMRFSWRRWLRAWPGRIGRWWRGE